MYPVWWARHIYSCWVQVSHKVANKEGLLLFWPMLKMCPHLKCFLCAHVEFDGTCRFLPLWHCAETVWSVNYNFLCIYSTYVLFFNLSQSHCSPRHFFHANYFWPTFRVLWCNGQNRPCNCRSATTLCVLRAWSWLRLKNNSVQSLYRPATSHAGSCCFIGCVATHSRGWCQMTGTTTKQFCLHAQEEAIATQDQKVVCPNSWGCPFIKSVIFLLCTRGYPDLWYFSSVYGFRSLWTATARRSV